MSALLYLPVKSPPASCRLQVSDTTFTTTKQRDLQDCRRRTVSPSASVLERVLPPLLCGSLHVCHHSHSYKYIPGDWVVHPLVESREDPTFALADVIDFHNLPRGKVGQCKFLKLPLCKQYNVCHLRLQIHTPHLCTTAGLLPVSLLWECCDQGHGDRRYPCRMFEGSPGKHWPV